MTTGLFIGRFQPFHLAHLQDIKDVLEEVDLLHIGIGSANEHHTKDNPFTTQERKGMIKKVLKKEHITNYDFIDVEDCESDEEWVESIQKKISTIDMVFTGNDWTEQCFKNKNIKVKKITLIPNISSTIIRDNIRNKREWKRLVPQEIHQDIEQYIKEDRF